MHGLKLGFNESLVNIDIPKKKLNKFYRNMYFYLIIETAYILLINNVFNFVITHPSHIILLQLCINITNTVFNIMQNIHSLYLFDFIQCC